MSKGLLAHRIPIIFFAPAVLLFGVLTWKFYRDKKELEAAMPAAVAAAPPATVALKTTRKPGKLTHALVLVDIPEDPSLSPLRSRIETLIDNEKKAGRLLKASMYLRRLDGGSWTGIDQSEGYHPASLIKVPVLMTYLAASEERPALLDEKILFDSTAIKVPSQTFTETPRLVSGRSYTVRELLRYMAAYSDNYATILLLQRIDLPRFKKLFTEIGLPEPPASDMNFRISAEDYGRFFRVLYNASYLTQKNSEYALSILAESTFQSGIEKGVPSGTTIARKFGEFNDGANKELHEAGIVYNGNDPYLLILMSEGKAVEPLTNFFGEASKMVHEGL